MLKDHPVIERMERQGYLIEEPFQAFDDLGYPLSKGDPILKLNGKVFSEENLTLNEQIILSECGALEDEA